MDSCKSCSHERSVAEKYCPHCGAKYIDERLSVKKLCRDFLKLITNLEGPFISTTKNLFVAPQSVTVGYIDGVRKSIVSPLRFAIIALTVYGVFQFLFSDFIEQIGEQELLDSVLEGFNKAYSEELDDPNVVAQSRIDSFKELLQKHNQFTNFFLIPILGFVCSVTYESSKYNYAERVSVAIYAVSLSLLIGTSLGFIFGLINNEWSRGMYGLFTLLVNVIVVVWVLWKTYGESISNSIFTFILSYIAYGFLMLVLFFVLVYLG